MSAPAVPLRRRLAAVASLGGYVLAFGASLWMLYEDLLPLLLAWLGLLAVGSAGWFVLTRRGAVRKIALGVMVVGVLGVVAVLIAWRTLLELALVLALVAVAIAATRYALRLDRASLRTTIPQGVRTQVPRHPALLMNPRSGGGKVERFDLVGECGRRGIEAVVLEPGDDLEGLARAAVAHGADVLGMAGGDGSQALVAGIASEHDLPFVCVPAGTRNHLALDLGVDRDDVVGALDAFSRGYERQIDLATVNGRIFVNNVSLGVYARVVQSDAYREDKLGTVAEMLPDLLGTDFDPFDLEISVPGGGARERADLVLISNNEYLLDQIGGFGSRPRIDAGVLGVVTVEVRSAADLAELLALQAAGGLRRFRGYRQWTASEVEVRSGSPIEAGVDGEADVFDPPLRARIRPGALRVRIAPHHPGVSPAATAVAAHPRHGAFGRLLRVAAGRDPGGVSS